MSTQNNMKITVSALIDSTIERVWLCWTSPFHIIHWCNASDDWQTSYAGNDLKPGGKFISHMEAKDGSTGFDFTGDYNKIEVNKAIEYTITGGRKVKVIFKTEGDKIRVTETFDAEEINPAELQQKGWQAILNNFKKYVENAGNREHLHFEITIDCEPESVYKTMFDEQKYKEWTSVFNPTSRFKGLWEKGSKILFLGKDEDGNTGGMVSRIRENIANKFISIEHLGIIQNDREITSGPEAESWSGSLENYSFIAQNGRTILAVDIDSNQEFKSYFSETWPKALDKLRSLSECE